MDKKELQKMIEIASGRKKADLIIYNCTIVDVCSGSLSKGNVAISDGYIAGIGDYEGETTIDAKGAFLLPGFIDSHIHIESSYLSPHELGRLLIPHGGTTIIADPHEIVNVCGLAGLKYMMQSAEHTALDIQFMLPSCVPATPFENAGASVEASDMGESIQNEKVLGIGEFMNYPGIIAGDEEVLDKLMVAKNAEKYIDGHSPGLTGKGLNTYACAGVRTDHECSNVSEMKDRIERGMYVLMREGSACHDLRALLPGVTEKNSRRCLLCSDDRQPKTIFEKGHIDNHLRICVEEGLDAITAIQMATINAAECYGLMDRGMIAPGKRADLVLVKDLKDFEVQKVLVEGRVVAENGTYTGVHASCSYESVRTGMRVKDFSKERLALHLTTPYVHVIEILPDGVVTKNSIEQIRLDEKGDFVFEEGIDIVKTAVIERHHNTGNAAVGLLKGYGIKEGAIALSVAHDSHNIICVGTSNEEMAFAVDTLIRMEGGIVLTKKGQIIESMPLPIAGLMSDQSGEWVRDKLLAIHRAAHDELGIGRTVEPVMTLCFMSLPVIPQIKLTDKGLFDVDQFKFISLEACKDEKDAL